MRFHSIILAAAAISTPASAETETITEVKVDVYEGPTECEDDDKVQPGNRLSMHYTGKIDESSATGEKGKEFDSSRGRGDTFDFTIGQGSVIQGWEEGLLGLCKGAKANIVIPPDMGYGEQGAGADIPGGATLHFDVEVVDVQEGVPGEPNGMPNVFKQIDLNEDNKLDKSEIDEFFKGMGTATPEEIWEMEDKDKDGFISWDEFSGPKTDPPGAGDEL